MKKAFVLLLLITVISCCISCGVYEKKGIDKYSKGNSSFSLSVELLPSDNFLTQFSYIDGNYYYIDKGGSFTYKDEQEIMYLVYEDDVYERAKEFTFQNIYFLENHKYSYNGYEFMVNMCRQMEGRDPNIVNSEFNPYWFNMIAFNDEKNTIVFLGFYMPKNLATPEIEQLLTFEDMGAFLKEYFSFYDFDA